MDIEFNKWMVDHAEGFDLCRDVIKHIRSGQMLHSNKINNWYFYPLLLQRAIEGIESKTDYDISAFYHKAHNEYESVIYNYPNDEINVLAQFEGCTSIDQAKEQALKYIYDQEMKYGH